MIFNQETEPSTVIFLKLAYFKEAHDRSQSAIYIDIRSKHRVDIVHGSKMITPYLESN